MNVTRAEMAAALVDVIEGRIPNDRIALKVLWEEMSNWPGLDIDRSSKNQKPGSKRRSNDSPHSPFQ